MIDKRNDFSKIRLRIGGRESDGVSSGGCEMKHAQHCCGCARWDAARGGFGFCRFFRRIKGELEGQGCKEWMDRESVAKDHDSSSLPNPIGQVTGPT